MQLVHRLRNDVIPDVLGGTGASAMVGGLTALFIDVAGTLGSRLPLFIGAVIFLSFVLGDERIIKLFGLGLASAIFIDATIVRMILVPATMELIGPANWWLPRWLDRILPNVTVEKSLELLDDYEREHLENA